MEEAIYDTSKAIEAQTKYCKEHSLPMFAPSNGHCYRCGSDIYQSTFVSEGITVQRAASRHITGCPHCHYSFCD